MVLKDDLATACQGLGATYVQITMQSDVTLAISRETIKQHHNSDLKDAYGCN
jgi:hypothetical protein